MCLCWISTLFGRICLPSKCNKISITWLQSLYISFYLRANQYTTFLWACTHRNAMKSSIEICTCFYRDVEKKHLWGVFSFHSQSRCMSLRGHFKDYKCHLNNKVTYKWTNQIWYFEKRSNTSLGTILKGESDTSIMWPTGTSFQNKQWKWLFIDGFYMIETRYLSV